MSTYQEVPYSIIGNINFNKDNIIYVNILLDNFPNKDSNFYVDFANEINMEFGIEDENAFRDVIFMIISEYNPNKKSDKKKKSSKIKVSKGNVTRIN